MSKPFKTGETHGNYDHGHASQGVSLTYHTWEGIKKRCLNPNCINYNDYGGRGITVDERWLDFRNFLEDMGEKPKGYSLDRIDNDRGYSKENCRWADLATQSNNRRNNRRYEYSGKTLTIAQWAKEYNLSHKLVHQRIFRDGMSIEEALNKKRSRW